LGRSNRSNLLSHPEAPRELAIVDTAHSSVRGQGRPYRDIVGGEVVHATRAVFGIPRAMALWSAVLQEPPGVARVVISFIGRGQCGIVSNARRLPKEVSDLKWRGNGTII
jgi:hypothetical protein